MAQCAMCRSTLENNYSSGNPGIGAGINTGILYLLSMPYLAAIIIGGLAGWLAIDSPSGLVYKQMFWSSGPAVWRR